MKYLRGDRYKNLGSMKRSGASKFDYFINPAQFAAYCGVTLADLEGRLKP